jgi:hypothetical protein
MYLELYNQESVQAETIYSQRKPTKRGFLTHFLVSCYEDFQIYLILCAGLGYVAIIWKK